MAEPFTFVDGERLIRFGRGALDEASDLLSQRGFAAYALLTTPRGRGPAGALDPDEVLEVPPGRVDEIAAELRPHVRGRELVALGGGRVIDTAKALAGADGVRCAAIPTTLSGAELTPFHRLPAGAEGAHLVRPALVIADPALMASQPMPDLAASAMNALAHAVEALYTPLANPVSWMAGAQAAVQIGEGLELDEPDRDALALGALLAGYASGIAGFAFHHALCQTIVRLGGTPHAQTNAVMLQHTVEYVRATTPERLEGLHVDVARLSARAGARRLSELGLEPDRVDAIVDAAAPRAEMRNTPRPPEPDDIRRLVQAAL